MIWTAIYDLRCLEDMDAKLLAHDQPLLPLPTLLELFSWPLITIYDDSKPDRGYDAWVNKLSIIKQRNVRKLAATFILSGDPPVYASILAINCSKSELETIEDTGAVTKLVPIGELDSFAEGIAVSETAVAKYKDIFYKGKYEHYRQTIRHSIEFYLLNPDIKKRDELVFDADPFMHLLPEPANVEGVNFSSIQLFDWKFQLAQNFNEWRLIDEIADVWNDALALADIQQMRRAVNSHKISLAALMEILGFPLDAKDAYDAGVPLEDILA